MKNTASRCRGYFYPRSPCGERRLSYFYIIKITQFLSTLSLRRATIPDREPAAGYLISIHALLAESDPTRWAPTCRISNFYPRSPCGERRSAQAAFPPGECISIHALLAESDYKDHGNSGRRGISIHALLAESDHGLNAQNLGNIISIHALLAESDDGPRGSRLRIILFLSTLSLRRATGNCRTWTYERLISIHALLAESDY